VAQMRYANGPLRVWLRGMPNHRGELQAEFRILIVPSRKRIDRQFQSLQPARLVLAMKKLPSLPETFTCASFLVVK
jgi:hypothetical protein